MFYLISRHKNKLAAPKSKGPINKQFKSKGDGDRTHLDEQKLGLQVSSDFTAR